MDWEYDWLGNAEYWNDDANQFYERSIGDITNGSDLTSADRPGALRIASNIGYTTVRSTVDRGGWLEVDYGHDGDVTALTVHADCHDDDDPNNGDTNYEICQPNPTATTTYNQRVNYLRDRCICRQEQHYTYRWDEVNRIAEGYRFERTGGSGPWTMMVRQRYLYDSANDRTVKQTLDSDVLASVPEAVALYVYPGDFERRGLVRSFSGTSYDALPGAETQYVIGGARVIYRDATHGGTGIDRDQRITIGLSDLIQSTSATLDLVTGELVETSNYYANGARESYRGSTAGDRVAPEPMGFTGKEADEEVGLTYFGQRYLMAHLGRWASPDPLQTHAVGGGEALNGYHYVAGSVLQARDELGLDLVFTASSSVLPSHLEATRVATRTVAAGMANDLARYFGIVSSYEVGTTSELGRLVHTSSSSGAELEASYTRAILLRIETNVRGSADATATAPEVDTAVASAQSRWTAARDRLVSVLDGFSDSPVTVRETVPGGAGAPIIGWWYDGRDMSLNPFTWGTGFGASSDGARSSMGALFLMIHEYDHKLDCLVGGGCGDALSSEAGGGEQRTVDDVDPLRSMLGLPTRDRYAPGGRANSPGGRFPLSDGESVTWPDQQSLTPSTSDSDGR